MRIFVALLLFFGALHASPTLLCSIDRELCCLEQRHIALLAEAHSLSESANWLYWHQGMETDVRALRWRACRKRRTAGRVCCRIQKLRTVRAAVVREAQKGVSYEPCID